MSNKQGDDGLLIQILCALLASVGAYTLIMTGGIVHMYRHPEVYMDPTQQRVETVSETTPSDSSSANAKTASAANNSQEVSQNTVNVAPIEEAISAVMLQDYQEGKKFLVKCEEEADGSITANIQISQDEKDVKSAVRLSSKCFEIAKKEVENAGLSFGKASTTVSSNGKPLGMFSTNDGEKFSHMLGGKVTEMSLSDLGKSASQKEEAPAQETKPAAEGENPIQKNPAQAKPTEGEPAQTKSSNKPAKSNKTQGQASSGKSSSHEAVQQPAKVTIVPIDEGKADTSAGSNQRKASTSSGNSGTAKPISRTSGDTTVYVSNSANKIHSMHDCSGMKNYREMTKSEADSHGYKYCKDCWV